MRITAEFTPLEHTAAMIGVAGGYAIVADRPPGRAGGEGRGLNGAQLLALALGGCFANDLHYAAEALGTRIGDAALRVTLWLEGEPLRVTRAALRFRCDTAPGGDAAAVAARAQDLCTVANSLRPAFPVTFHDWDAPESEAGPINNAPAEAEMGAAKAAANLPQGRSGAT